MSTVTWMKDGYPVESLDDVNEGAIGFAYRITFDCGMLYIGRKNLYEIKRLKKLKGDKVREGHIQFIGGYEIVRRESNWKKYNGSAKECKIYTPKYKEILEYAYNDAELTYLEAMYLFKNDVLRKTDYINKNIDGRYFSWRIKG